MADRDLSRREIDEEGRYREWREPPHTTFICGANRIDDGREAADTGADDGRGALARTRVLRRPSGLRDCFIRRHHGELNEAIHLLLVFFRNGAIRIEPEFRIFNDVRHHAACLDGQIGRHVIRQSADAGLPCDQARPVCLDAAAKRRDGSHSGDDNASYGAASFHDLTTGC